MSPSLEERIRQQIQSHPILLYMKGEKGAPACGFSAQVLQILESYQVPYHCENILEDWDLREGIKAYSQWPTIPQLYLAGEFIGGCDITMELHRKGQLKELLEKAQESSHS